MWNSLESGQRRGTQLTEQELVEALPIEGGDGVAGYLYLITPGRGGLAAPEQAFLDQINRSLLQAALLAAALGLLLGLVFVAAGRGWVRMTCQRCD